MAKLYIVILSVLVIMYLIYKLDSSGKISHLFGFRTPSAKASEDNWRLAQQIGYGVSIPLFAIVLILNLLINIPLLINIGVLIVYAAFIITFIEQKLD